jgi:hypothetical protein
LGINDKIVFASNLNGERIKLTRGQFNELGELPITQAVTIDASMLEDGITIDAIGNDPTPDEDNLDGTTVFWIELFLQPGDVAPVTLRNLTLTGGDASAGGAIYFRAPDFSDTLTYGVLSVEDCTIRDNHGGAGGGIWGEFGFLNITRTVVENNKSYTNGGGLHLRHRSAVITDCLIRNNHAIDGGGVHVLGNPAPIGRTVELVRTIVADNTASNTGGGVQFGEETGYPLASVTITGCQFLRNQAVQRGGGVWAIMDEFPLEPPPSITIADSVLAGNSATDNSGGFSGLGGGLFIHLVGHYSVPTLTITACLLDNNEAARDGGGAYIASKNPAEVNIVNSTFANNAAGSVSDFETFGRGGGLWIANDGGIEASLLSASIQQTTLSRNGALVEGGGIWTGITYAELDYGEVANEFDFVTIHDNWAPTGGGLFSQQDARVSTTLKNSIVSGNRAAEDINGAANNVAGAVESASSFNLWGTSTATLPTGTNLFSDAPGLRPLADNGGRRLPNGDAMLTHQPRHDSPAIDAGDPSVTFNANEFDQRGPNFFRVFNQAVTNANRGPVDIGAIELGAVRVMDVLVREFDPTHDEFSFAEGTFQGEPMTGSGNQLRTVPVGGSDTVSIRFSEEMPTTGMGAIGASSLDLIGLAFGTAPSPHPTTPFVYDSNTLTATWRFSAALPADQYVIIVPDSVKDMSGNELDGDWTNPFSIFTTSTQVSTFPSGDGAKGGDFAFVMTILPGDHDRDNWVDGIGFIQWQQMIGSDKDFEEGDFDGDDDTDGDDLAIYNANYGIQLVDMVYADFNGDFIVDGDDYAIWSANYGASDTEHQYGDADGDEWVLSNDFVIWQQQIGLEIHWDD